MSESKDVIPLAFRQSPVGPFTTVTEEGLVYATGTAVQQWTFLPARVTSCLKKPLERNGRR